MLKSLEWYYKPTTLKEAIDLLSKKKLNPIILAGGTSIVNRNATGVKALVDIKGLKLNYIKTGKTNIRIGALTTINELLKNKDINKYYNGFIYNAAYYIASTPVRNLITMGGNITQIYPWSDLPLAMLLLDVKVTTVNKKGAKTYKYSELLKDHPTKVLKGSIVKEITLPNKPFYKGGFIKFSKTNFDYALLDVAVLAKIENKIYKDIRIGISATSPMPQILKKASSIMKGSSINDTITLEKALSVAYKEARINNDIRVSKSYKRDIIPVLIKRIIKSLT